MLVALGLIVCTSQAIILLFFTSVTTGQGIYIYLLTARLKLFNTPVNVGHTQQLITPSTSQ